MFFFRPCWKLICWNRREIVNSSRKNAVVWNFHIQCCFLDFNFVFFFFSFFFGTFQFDGFQFIIIFLWFLLFIYNVVVVVVVSEKWNFAIFPVLFVYFFLFCFGKIISRDISRFPRIYVIKNKLFFCSLLFYVQCYQDMKNSPERFMNWLK